jgi:HEAT repeat protein
VPTLIEFVGGPDARLRQHACEALRIIGENAEQAVPALIKALSDHDMEVRASAARALGGIGPKAWPATSELIEVTKEGPPEEVRVSAQEALLAVLRSLLARQGPETTHVVRLLLLQARNSDREIRDTCLYVFMMTGDKAAPAVKKALLDEDAHVRESAAFVLREVIREDRE